MSVEISENKPRIKHFLLYVIASIASLGGLLSGFDTGVISGALLYINETWPLSTLAQGWVVSSALVGAVAGAAVNGVLADVYGRKKVIVATAAVFAVGSVLCGLAPGIGWLVAGRIVLGLAIGMVNFVIPLYLSELSPQKVRGMLVSLYQLAITAGILFSYLINRIFRKIEPECDAEAQVREIKSTLKQSGNNRKNIFERWMLRPIMVGVAIMFIQICTGINTIIYYAATIFKAAGFTDNIGALYASVGVGVVNFAMTFVAIFFTDRLGRKPLLYVGLSGITLSLFVLSVSFWLGGTYGYDTKWLSVGSIVTFIACFAFSLGPIAWILISEIMPLAVRGTAMSIATMSNFVFNFIVALIFPTLLASIGESATFAIFGIVGIFSLFYTWRYIPETKGRSLEQIERNWKEGLPVSAF